MLELRATLHLKHEKLDTSDCQITKVMVLPGGEFDDLILHPLKGRSFIAENKDRMGFWNNDLHCLLLLGEDRKDGVLVNSEGTDYARYAAYLSNARGYVEQELEKAANFLLKDITPDDDGSLAIYLEDIEEFIGAEVGAGSDLARMFQKNLERHSAVDTVACIGDCMLAGPAATPELVAPDRPRLKDLMLLGPLKNAYMVHDTADIGFVYAAPLHEIDEQDRESHSALLEAQVSGIRTGAYGTEIVLTNIDPQLLVDFDRSMTGQSMNEEPATPY